MIPMRFLAQGAFRVLSKVRALACILFVFSALAGAARAQVAAPTMVPSGTDAYPVSQNVVISCATPGAIIYYTVNGVDPTQSDQTVASGGSVVINRPLTLKAKAFHTTLGESAVTTFFYGIYGQVAAGKEHSIALATDGTVWAWGSNKAFQLGSSTVTASKTPLQIAGFSSVIAVAAGDEHNVALKADGTVWTWGRNGNGQLGNNTTISRATPMQVSGLNGIVEVAAGSNFSVALKSDGTVWTWGDNTNGRLGDNSTTQRLTPVQVYTLTNVANIAAGGAHVLALMNDGTLMAWGNNANGQLGNNSILSSKVPVVVSTLSTVTQIEAGASHSVALKGDGTVWAWGLNSSRQLGDGSVIQRTTPVQTTGVSGVAAVSAGENFTVAVTTSGAVWSWGLNGNGQLGLGNTIVQLSPMQLPSLSGIVGVSCGTRHAVAIKNNGTLWAWGDNGTGRLGDGTTQSPRTSPVQVRGPVGAPYFGYIRVVDALLDADGDTVPNWQEAEWGTDPNLADTDGDGVSDATDTYPVDFFNNALPTVTIISGDNQVALAGQFLALPFVVEVKNASSTPLVNAPVAFSPSNGLGYTTTSGGTTATSLQVRTDASGRVTVYVKLPSTSAGPYSPKASAVTPSGTAEVTFTVTDKVLNPVLSPAPGIYSLPQLVTVTCATAGASIHYTTNGVDPTLIDPTIASGAKISVTQSQVLKVKAWHTNYIPSDVVGGVYNIAGQVTGGTQHTLAIRPDGALWAWGINTQGCLGDGTTLQRSNPMPVSSLLPIQVKAVAAGDNFSLAVKTDGTLWSWGVGDFGGLGLGTTADKPLPTQVTSLSSVASVSARKNHVLVVTTAGVVWGFGNNDAGGLGPNGVVGTPSLVPLQVPITNVVAVAAGKIHSLALKNDGTVWSWGGNTDGQLGTGNTKNNPTPTQITALSNIVAIVAGDKFSMALKADGTVWAWGQNSDGQLGTGNTSSRNTPIQVPGLTGVMALAVGDNHSVALKADGTVSAWGKNVSGQLGDGTNLPRTTPVAVSTLTNVISIGAGSDASFAVKNDLTIWSWGGNLTGKLGDGTMISRNLPVQVSTSWTP